MLRSSIIRKGGVALVIVLAFVVLLVGIVVAYLGRSATGRQLAHGTYNAVRADQLARSALGIVVSDLKQEIGNEPIVTSTNILPKSSPRPAPGSTPPIPNLVRRSVRSDTIVPGSRASAVNSTSDPSSNGRFVSLARWNSHYLIPKVNTGNDDSEPITTGFSSPAYWAPDWVVVTRDGPVAFPGWDSNLTDPSQSNRAYAVGRYAYTIYNEGGLLDVNVAGYPTDANLAGTVVATDAPVGGKGWLALVDLVPIVSAATIKDSRSAINSIIGWRNYAAARPSGAFPDFTFSAASGSTWFTNFVVNNSSGFLQTSDLKWKGPSGLGGDRTDQAFVTRQQLIAYRATAGISVSALQYMGTFSRELNYPTWTSATTQRVTASFTRRDGTTAKIGEPLIRRFPIGELAWIGSTGVVAPGTSDTVKRDFGLFWEGDHWDYRGPTGSALASSIPGITGDREPDFFQLLQLAQPSATILQILTIGACLIDQYDGPSADSANLTTRIDFAGPATPPATTNSIAWGMENMAPPQPTGAPSPRGAFILNRAFSNVGEFGYANRDVTLPAPAPIPRTLDFYTAASSEAAILDLFGVSNAAKRAGTVDLNTPHDPVMRSILSFATATEQPSAALSSARRNSTANGLIIATAANLATSRQDVARLAQQSGITGGEEIQEVVARSLSDTCQTRTWNLLIDVVAQSGRYPPNASALSNFLVEGEKRYWLHVAIDRFTGEVIDQQLEAVYE